MRLNELQVNQDIIDVRLQYCEGMENWTSDQWEKYRLKGHSTFDDKELNRFIDEEILPDIVAYGDKILRLG